MKKTIALALLLGCGVTEATVFYSSTYPVNTSTWSDLHWDYFTAAAKFSLAADDTLKSIRWRGIYDDGYVSYPPADDFTINIRAADGWSDWYIDDLPGTLIASFAVGSSAQTSATGEFVNGREIYEYAADVGEGIVLSANIDYWIEIINRTTGGIDGLQPPNWAWAGCLACDEDMEDSAHSAVYGYRFYDSHDYYFELNNTSRDTVPAFACVGFGIFLDDAPVAVQKQRMLPLKAHLINPDGQLVDDLGVSKSPVAKVQYEGGDDTAPDITDELTFAGLGAADNHFEFIGSQWRYNLNIKSLRTSGSYKVTLRSGDSKEYSISSECSTVFVIR